MLFLDRPAVREVEVAQAFFSDQREDDAIGSNTGVGRYRRLLADQRKARIKVVGEARIRSFSSPLPITAFSPTTISLSSTERSMCAPCLMTVSCIMIESFTNAPLSITTPGERTEPSTVPETMQPRDGGVDRARGGAYPHRRAVIRQRLGSMVRPYVAGLGRQPGIGPQKVHVRHPSKPESSPRPSSIPRKDNRRRGPLLRPWE